MMHHLATCKCRSRISFLHRSYPRTRTRLSIFQRQHHANDCVATCLDTCLHFDELIVRNRFSCRRSNALHKFRPFLQRICPNQWLVQGTTSLHTLLHLKRRFYPRRDGIHRAINLHKCYHFVRISTCGKQGWTEEIFRFQGKRELSL